MVKNEIEKLADMELGTGVSVVDQADEDTLRLFKDRFEEMKKARLEAESEWRYSEKVMTDKPKVKGNGQILPNMTMENALLETYLGSRSAGLPIQVATEGRPDGILTEIIKQTLQHFIRVEHIEEAITVEADYAKGKYGTCCIFSGITVESKFVAQGKNKYLEDGKPQMKKIDQYHITAKNISPRDCRFDDVTKFSDAEDCIWREKISENMFRARYFDSNGKPMKGYKNLDHVKLTQSNRQEYNGNDKTDKKDVVILYHYFNKIMGYYWIIANEDVVIYNGYATTQHGELPLIPIQHYYNDSRIWGDSIPKRYAVVKGINNNLISDILGGSRLNSGGLLVQGAGTSTEGEIYIEPGEIQIVEMTEGNARDIQPINMQVNVQQLRDILTLMDDYGIILTGLNFKAPYTSPAKTAFETSVMQEEQNNRLKTPAVLRDMGLSKVFQIMICNILQFAPYLYVERIWDEDTGKSTPRDVYYIPLKDKKIHWKDEDEGGINSTINGLLSRPDGLPSPKKDQGDMTIDDITELEEAEGYEDYFEMSSSFFDSDKLLNAGQGIKVYIQTANTPATMKALEIENFTKFVQVKMQMEQAKALTAQAGGDIKLYDEIENKLNQLFGIDPNNVILKSNADRFKDKLAELNQMIMSMGQILQPTTQNAPTQQQGLQQAQGMGENSEQNAEIQPAIPQGIGG